MKCNYFRRDLQFYRPSGTSRGVLKSKETWIIVLEEDGHFGVGECGLLRGLSRDDRPDYEQNLAWLRDSINSNVEEIEQELQDFPSILFGFEQAMKSLRSEDPFVLFSNEFSKGEDGIDINGLVWMGDISFMKKQIGEKIDQGYRCIKLKIGALDFKAELDLIHALRREYSSDDIEVRVDANGAFSKEDALEKLKRLHELELHSIEQPIKAGQFDEMRALCEQSPLSIALDEELIAKCSDKIGLLKRIRPQYIILKPSLLGGYEASHEWINAADEMGISYWVTSALESNIGLNAIAQWTYDLKIEIPQGLGTGQLYSNNFVSPLEISQGSIYYRSNLCWDNGIIKSVS